MGRMGCICGTEWGDGGERAGAAGAVAERVVWCGELALEKSAAGVYCARINVHKDSIGINESGVDIC